LTRVGNWFIVYTLRNFSVFVKKENRPSNEIELRKQRNYHEVPKEMYVATVGSSTKHSEKLL
jgi:hypothetical protein